MKCAYHADKEAVTRCSACEKSLCDECAVKDDSGADICTRCAALQAAQDASRGIDRRQAEVRTRKHEAAYRKTRKKKFKVALQWVVLATCLTVMVFQLPRLLSIFDEGKPIRLGTYATNENADKCIRNLWRAARLLQEGKQPGADLVCPETGNSYVVATNEDDTMVSCPNPGAHGFSEIRVSRKHPVPEVIK